MGVMFWRNLPQLTGKRQRERLPFLIASAVALALGYAHIAGVSLASFHHLLDWIFGGIGDYLLTWQRYPFWD